MNVFGGSLQSTHQSVGGRCEVPTERRKAGCGHGRFSTPQIYKATAASGDAADWNVSLMGNFPGWWLHPFKDRVLVMVGDEEEEGFHSW